MDTKVFIMEDSNIDINGINKCGDIIKKGGIVAFPTETVYGLGGNALDSSAVRKIFEAKGRPQDNPLIIHVNNFNIENLVEEVPKVAKELMKRFFPGPLTIILKKKPIVPMETSAGLETIGIRMPDNEIALKLIEESGVPIAAPSANISGKPSPTDVLTCIKDLKGKVEGILGGSSSKVGVESTIIDCTVEPPCVLRPGGITLEQLKEVDNSIYVDPAIMEKPKADFKPKAPGMKYRHYAPKAPVKIIKGDLQKTIEKINEMVQNYIDNNKTVGIIATDETKALYKSGEIISLGSRNNMNDIAKNLFSTLRAFDQIEVDVILSEAFSEEGIGLAIMNRLNKSAGFHIIEI
ncbi:L-threonylcarbamoyladenylate synthase [Clostridium hydrogeniformans]|uniref:L-threonylcarbamoyladenylate synthase n=1 Tax=Clostridium hydrogeniformans TaxID=349933 RepID=UPI000485EEE7|nr:L-threonylcarbamoyladenylate synthase [Clostridium hydrogeniformans]